MQKYRCQDLSSTCSSKMVLFAYFNKALNEYKNTVTTFKTYTIYSFLKMISVGFSKDCPSPKPGNTFVSIYLLITCY